jgi:hypothetical protein
VFFRIPKQRQKAVARMGEAMSPFWWNVFWFACGVVVTLFASGLSLWALFYFFTRDLEEEEFADLKPVKMEVPTPAGCCDFPNDPFAPINYGATGEYAGAEAGPTWAAPSAVKAK